MVPVVVVPQRLQRHFGRKLPVAGVPGVDKKTGLQFMKLQMPLDRDGTVCRHFESGVFRQEGCPWPASASFKSHFAQEVAPLQVPLRHQEGVDLGTEAGTAGLRLRLRLLTKPRGDLGWRKGRQTGHLRGFPATHTETKSNPSLACGAGISGRTPLGADREAILSSRNQPPSSKSLWGRGHLGPPPGNQVHLPHQAPFASHWRHFYSSGHHFP